MPAEPAPDIPADLTAALSAEPAADRAFRALPPSHRREYLDWISEAKRPDTRARRVAGTVKRVLEAPAARNAVSSGRPAGSDG